MKTTIKDLFIVLLTAASLQAAAQVSLKEGIVRSQKGTYTVTSNRGYYSVAKQNNNITVSSSERAKELESISFLDGKDIPAVVKETLSASRLQALLPERNFICTIKFDKSGAVTAVTFLFHQNTVITTSEIDSLDAAIRSKVKIRIPNAQKSESAFLPLSQNILISRLLNK